MWICQNMAERDFPDFRLYRTSNRKYEVMIIMFGVTFHFDYNGDIVRVKMHYRIKFQEMSCRHYVYTERCLWTHTTTSGTAYFIFAVYRIRLYFPAPPTKSKKNARIVSSGGGSRRGSRSSLDPPSPPTVLNIQLK